MRKPMVRLIIVLALIGMATPAISERAGKAGKTGKARQANRLVAEGEDADEANGPTTNVPLPPPPEHPVMFPNCGIYDLEGKTDFPFIRGEQIGLQWAQCEPEEGKYDFSAVDKGLEKAIQKKRCVVIKLNGNNKPDYLFNKVPSHPEVWDVQVNDKRTLMFWHENFKTAYFRLLAAYADYLKKNPHKDIITGLRLNYDAIGTEHWEVPAQCLPLSQWECPPGVAQGPEYSREMVDQYKSQVVDVFVKNFVPDFRVFCRTNIEQGALAKHADLFATGKMGWFHTGAGMEENQCFNQEHRYSRFLAYCRPGYSYGFTESASITKWMPKFDYSVTQWEYWRVLSELNAGVSYLSFYPNELTKAADNPAIRDAYVFGAKYAGYHAQPATSPGAWVALRGKGLHFPGDYTFLMSRWQEDASTEVTMAGSKDQPFGAWARSLPPNQGMYFNLHDKFFASRGEKGVAAALRVVYLDTGKSAWELRYDGMGAAEQRALAVTNADSGQWKEAQVDIADGRFENRSPHGADVVLFNTGPGAVVFHFVELTRK